MPQRVFEGILNFDEAILDSRCIKCDRLLEFTGHEDGVWSSRCCDIYHTLTAYTVVRDTEVAINANTGTT